MTYDFPIHEERNLQVVAMTGFFIATYLTLHDDSNVYTPSTSTQTFRSLQGKPGLKRSC